ncbi:hypothetical protein JTE90_014724 [Oedothorax gibbosus]|uniref:Uncharacterized protein n=1 Tax=Oedothorax gibbosus TaxID=931172 RepID=A0AAV6US36_9ARAC|nr:hypothetical protein JTE90_014724 [Oedothorax gibbosus]
MGRISFLDLQRVLRDGVRQKFFITPSSDAEEEDAAKQRPNFTLHSTPTAPARKVFPCGFSQRLRTDLCAVVR